MNIGEMRSLGKKLIENYADEPVDAYVIEKVSKMPETSDVNRAGCSPIGVDLNIWPTFEGRRMHHVITLDLCTTPKLLEKIENKSRAISLFISDPNIHDADRPGTRETQLVYLDDSNIELGVVAKNPSQNSNFRLFEPCTYVCHEISLPERLYDADFGEKYIGEIEHESVNELYEFVCGCSLAGGKPIWHHSNYYEGKPFSDFLILQINEDLVDMNMGDTGSFYVFPDTAFCQ